MDRGITLLHFFLQLNILQITILYIVHKLFLLLFHPTLTNFYFYFFKDILQELIFLIIIM